MKPRSLCLVLSIVIGLLGRLEGRRGRGRREARRLRSWRARHRRRRSRRAGSGIGGAFVTAASSGAGGAMACVDPSTKLVLAGAEATLATIYATDYKVYNLGPVPGMPSGHLGGCVLSPTDPNTLYVAGDSEDTGEQLYTIEVERDACGHIDAFVGMAELVANAPYIDANLVFTPGPARSSTPSGPSVDSGSSRPARPIPRATPRSRSRTATAPAGSASSRATCRRRDRSARSAGRWALGITSPTHRAVSSSTSRARRS